MIFVTIGTQEPFDRLIKAMDEIAFAIKDTETVVAQVKSGTYEVQHMQTVDFLSPTEYERTFKESRLIVGHAGMGTIISALTNLKPIVVMPRLASLGEHRNDHQLAGAKKLEELNFINVAYDEFQLKEKVMRLFADRTIKPLHEVGDSASDQLINSLREFVKI